MKKIFFIIAFFLLFSLPKNVFATTKTVDVNNDTFIVISAGNTSYGTSDHMTVANTPAKSNALIGFETITIPPEAVIDKATLHFYVYDHQHTSNTNIRIGPNNHIPTFDENTANWNHGPHQSSDRSYDVTTSINISDGWKGIEITPIILAWQNGDVENNGLYITTNSSSDVLFRIKTKETSNKPYLTLEYHTVVLGEDEPTATPTDTPTPTNTPTLTPTPTTEAIVTTSTTQPTNIMPTVKTSSSSSTKPDTQTKPPQENKKQSDNFIKYIFVLIVVLVIAIGVIFAYLKFKKIKS